MTKKLNLREKKTTKKKQATKIGNAKYRFKRMENTPYAGTTECCYIYGIFTIGKLKSSLYLI